MSVPRLVGPLTSNSATECTTGVTPRQPTVRPRIRTPHELWSAGNAGRISRTLQHSPGWSATASMRVAATRRGPTGLRNAMHVPRSALTRQPVLAGAFIAVCAGPQRLEWSESGAPTNHCLCHRKQSYRLSPARLNNAGFLPQAVPYWVATFVGGRMPSPLIVVGPGWRCGRQIESSDPHS